VKAHQFIIPDIMLSDLFGEDLPPEIAVMMPDSLGDALDAELGFRVELGYILGSLQVSLETGCTHIAGSNPLVTDITMIPFMVKAGVEFSQVDLIGWTPYIKAGVMAVQVDHYETAIDSLTGNLTRDTWTSFVVAAGLELELNLHRSFTLEAGAELSLIVEDASLIPLVSVTVGVQTQPLTARN
jgi:hypothetical protein